MSTRAAVLSPTGLSDKVHLVGHVAGYLNDLFANDKKGNYKSFLTKINEAGDDPYGTSEGGRLEYNGHQFLEWKSGTTNRIFGFVFGDKVYVCMAAIDHKKTKYDGMTYDGQDEFSAKFIQKQLKQSQLDTLFAKAHGELGGL